MKKRLTIQNSLRFNGVKLVVMLLGAAVAVSPAWSQTTVVTAASATSKLDPLLVFVSCALIFLMQAGFALLEAGQARAKNTVNVLMKNYCDLCFGAIAFWAVGYGLMFGVNHTGWVGMSAFFAHGLAGQDLTYFVFQMMFAATSATIVSGAVAERTKFWGYIAMSIVVSGLIYPVYGAWAWGGWQGGKGWLAAMGYRDFAGSSVVHAVGGWCAMAALMVIKPRLGRYGSDGSARLIQGHNLSLVALGGLLLWFGWFGFNGGSLLKVSDQLGLVILNTHLGGAAAVVSALLGLHLFKQPILLSTVVNAGLAGLVAVTAAADVLQPGMSILIGGIAAGLAIVSMRLFDKWRFDDMVGAVSVHAIGGTWGVVAAGIFYTGSNDYMTQLSVQCLGAAAAFLWAFPVAWISFSLIHAGFGLRVDSMTEQRGLDFVEHFEIAYPEFQKTPLHQGKA